MRAGSSPHTRGAPRVPRHSVSFQDHPRIRGEHAVNFVVKIRWLRDHPRIRGEHGISNPPDYSEGDHPRIRGEHARGVACGRLPQRGIIPAYAGNTALQFVRWCAGSSPHTRGAQPLQLCSLLWWRDHPRIRGEHLATRAPSRSARDHPRIRGEHAA